MHAPHAGSAPDEIKTFHVYHGKRGPVKRKRALLRSNSPRDNRIGDDEISSSGGVFGLPFFMMTGISEEPSCLKNLGVWGRAPGT